MSLRTGTQVATIIEAIINPNNLKIEGFYCADDFSKARLILLGQDIRDFIPQGVVINDHDVLSESTELIRLKDVLDLRFQLLGKPVITGSKKRIGKVNDYAVEIETLYIKKLYVAQSILKNLSGGQLSVERNQIIEITNRKVVIQDPLQPTKSPVSAGAPVTS